MLRSIRWRLPLSYALIALLAALALGTVLTATLRDYYGQRETEYLERYALGVSMRASEMFRADLPADAMQAQFTGIAFLAQAHIRILDPQRGVIVDSGTPESHQVIVSYLRRGDEFPGDLRPDGGGVVAAMPATAARSFITIYGSGVNEVNAVALPPGIYLDNLTLGPRLVRDDVRFVAAPWNAPLDNGSNTAPQRSDKRVEVPVLDESGETLGYVEMFDGLAYGSAIVERVTSAWTLASAVAIVLAASVGWFISRSLSAPLIALTEVTMVMARGDLSARARVTRQDEIGRLSQSFDDMADRVEDTVNTLRRFVGDAAHELHTPLTALNANLELAVQEPDEARRQAFIARAREQVERLKSLTTDLLDLSRFESHRYADERSGVDLSALVREMSEVYASRAEQQGISFSHDLPPGEALVQANESQLRRLVGNLLDNAIKFTPEDGVVTIGLACAGPRVELWVRDTGIGIPPEDLPLLFSRFHRGRNTAAFPGSGLGLAIIKAIVEAHCGDVSVESGAHGTRFAVQLPATG